MFQTKLRPEEVAGKASTSIPSLLLTGVTSILLSSILFALFLRVFFYTCYRTGGWTLSFGVRKQRDFLKCDPSIWDKLISFP